MHPPAPRGILAATDLTEGADPVIRGAAALATLTGAVARRSSSPLLLVPPRLGSASQAESKPAREAAARLAS